MGSAVGATHREPWNKGKVVGQKAPFKLKDVWARRVRLQMENRVRELALLLGHSKLESTVRYLGIEFDDALEISEQREI